jgi:hypothetical protein
LSTSGKFFHRRFMPAFRGISSKRTKVVPAYRFNAGFAEQHASHQAGSTAMPTRRPANRLSECTPQWLALLVEMRLATPKQPREAHLRATKQAEQESGAAPDQPPPRRRRRKPD